MTVVSRWLVIPSAAGAWHGMVWYWCKDLTNTVLPDDFACIQIISVQYYTILYPPRMSATLLPSCMNLLTPSSMHSFTVLISFKASCSTHLCSVGCIHTYMHACIPVVGVSRFDGYLMMRHHGLAFIVNLRTRRWILTQLTHSHSLTAKRTEDVPSSTAAMKNRPLDMALRAC